MSIAFAFLALMCSVISVFLLLKDREGWEQKPVLDSEDETAALKMKPSALKACLVYSCACIALAVLTAVLLSIRNGELDMWTRVKQVVLLSVIWPVAYIDYKTLRIPNTFIVYGLGCRLTVLIFELLLDNPYVWVSLISEAIAAAGLLVAAVLCVLCVKNGLGFGDMKLFLVMGLFLGTDGAWSAIFLSLMISFVVSVFLLVSRKKGRKDAIPFGPALVIGTYLSVYLSIL